MSDSPQSASHLLYSAFGQREMEIAGIHIVGRCREAQRWDVPFTLAEFDGDDLAHCGVRDLVSHGWLATADDRTLRVTRGFIARVCSEDTKRHDPPWWELPDAIRRTIRFTDGAAHV